jgi:hypothetical protein
MALDHTLKPLTVKPGIQRDGTNFDSKSWIDGQWTRFYGESFAPRKMGGYTQASIGTPKIVRSVFPVSRSDTDDPLNPNNVNAFDLYLGSEDGVRYITFYENALTSPFVNRTPLGYTSNPSNMWTFDQMTTVDADVINSAIIAHVAPNTNNIASTQRGQVFYGDISDTNALTEITPAGSDYFTSAGGITVVSPNLFIYGENGVVQWSNNNDPSTWGSNQYAVISNTKIVDGIPIKGGALFWSMRELLRATQVPPSGSGTFQYTFDTVETDISILSSNSVIRWGQMYYWIGLSEFYYYNGVVQRIYNTYNSRYFFDNLNFNAREKVWGMAIPEYGELHWFWPKGNATECTNGLAYNVWGDFWFDYVLPRSAGVEPSYFKYPIMCDSSSVISAYPVVENSDTFPIWIHENGEDKTIGNNNYAIESYITTPYMSLFEGNFQTDLQMRSRRFEPDFELIGALQITVNNYSYPMSPPNNTIKYTLNPGDERVDMYSMGRLVTFTFNSNEAGGYYQMGKPLIDVSMGDVRQSQ